MDMLIHEAAGRGNLDTVQAVLTENPGLASSKDDNGYTPLHWACHSGRTEVVAMLLANHAEVNARDNLGWTPLDWAEANHHKDMVELLRQHGAHG